MKDKAKYTLLTLALLLCSVRAWTQAGVVFPVDVNVTLTPPYGTCLTDLAGSDRFRIQALLRDMSHPEFRMVIQMTVKDLSSLNVRFRSTTNEFSLNAGKPTKIIGRTSLDGIGISDFFESRNVSAGYSLLNGKCLPEGAYIFSFQAFDALSYGSARIPISREVSFTAFLEGGATPILTAPAQNDSIGCGSLSIRFSWMQPFVTSGLNTYRLQVMELNGDFPGTGLINSESNLMLNMQTMMPSYTWNPTAGGLEKGKSYLWRVVMCDKNGNPRSNYPNGGASETRKFVYCGEPQTAHKDPWAEWKQSEPKAKSIRGGLDTIRIDTVKTDGASGLSAFCLKDPQELRLNYDGIIVEVKKENNDSWAPFKLESRDVKDTIVGIGNIDYDKYYQARAQYFKYDGEQTIYAPYSRTVTFIVKHPADSIECGNELPPLSDCNGRQPQELKEGDRFNSNGSDVTILELTKQVRDGNALRISGTGYIDFPILRNFKFKVKFDDIKLNCDHQLTDGTLSSVYDKSTSATIDLNNTIGKGSVGYDLPQNDLAITDVQSLTEGNTETAPQGSLLSSGSSIFLKTNGGDTVQIGTKIDLSSPSVYVDEKTRSDDALVWFENADYANVAFDNDSTWEYHKRAALSDQYEFFVAGKYVIPWVATSPGRIVKVNARPGKGFNYTDLRFVLKTASGHIELNAEKNADGTYTLSVPGTEPANETHIYAIARPKDGRPFENVGRLKVACLEHRDQKVVLVPLARNLTIDRTAIERLLNRIYGKLGYTFSVSYDSDKAHTSGLAGIDSLNIGSGLLTEYSDEMKRVADTYIANISTSGSEIDKESAYLFLMNSASDPSVAGIMPQKHPFGFIFMNGKTSNDADLNRTIAHELGHGLWGLDHTFSSAYAFPKGSTTHLMDYAGGTYLAHFEWLQINKPVLSWSLFNSDEGNEAKDVFMQSGEFEKCGGSMEILSFLLRNDEIREKLAEEINLFQYNIKESDETKASYILNDVLKHCKIRDGKEAHNLIVQFIEIYPYIVVKENEEEIFNFLNNSNSLTKEIIIKKLTTLEKINRWSYRTTIISNLADLCLSVYQAQKTIDKISLYALKDMIITGKSNITEEGIKDAILSMSNTKFKDFLRNKITNLTNKQMSEIVSQKNKGIFSTLINDLSKPQNLTKKDLKIIFDNIPELQFYDICNKSKNFSIKPKVSNSLVSKFKPEDISKHIANAGNFLNILSLVELLRTSEKVSPSDIIGVIPHPIALSSYLIGKIADNLETEMTEWILEDGNWHMVENWDENYRGKNQVPNQTLYLYYVNYENEKIHKYNPDVIPTSIIIKDRNFATQIFGYTPTDVIFYLEYPSGELKSAEQKPNSIVKYLK